MDWNKVTVGAVPLFLADFSLLSCELDNFMFEVLRWVILYWYYIELKSIYYTFIATCENSKIVSFASLVIKKHCINFCNFTSSILTSI